MDPGTDGRNPSTKGYLSVNIALLAFQLMGFQADAFPDWRDRNTICAISVCRVPDPDSALLAAAALHRQSMPMDTLSAPYNVLLGYLMWPLEKTVPPALKFMLMPVQSPILEADQADVVDRAVQLVRIDESGRSTVYPTLTMDGGEGSRIGVTAVLSDLALRNTQLRFAGSLLLNLDWYASLGVSTPSAGPFATKGQLRLFGSSSANDAVWIPELSAIPVTTEMGLVSRDRRGAALAFPSTMGSHWLEPRVALQYTEVGDPGKFSSRLRDPGQYEWFSRGDRGVAGNERQVSAGFSVGRSDQDLEGTPTSGGVVSGEFDQTWAKGGGSFWTMGVQATRYILLGDERYVYRKGDLDPYLKLSPRTFALMMDVRTLPQRLSSRRVLAFQYRARWMRETEPEDHPASYYSFPTMGGSAPARAYGGGRLLDNSVMGGAVEYRWPIWKYIDGSLFLECAVAGSDPWRPDPDRIAPGWGTGIRVRTPGTFLFRVQLASGREGIRGIITVDPEF